MKKTKDVSITICLPISEDTHHFIKTHESTIKNMEEDFGGVTIGASTDMSQWDGKNGKFNRELVIGFPGKMQELESQAKAILREIERSKESFNTQPCCQSNHEENEEIDGETRDDIEFIRRNFQGISGEIDNFMVAECIHFKNGLPVAECRIGGHAMALLMKTFFSVYGYGTEE